jgi:predicted MFS family arabinose efflux permease
VLGPASGELDAGRLHLVSTVLAIACGLTAANLYYAQPLLDLLARTFGVSEGSAAVVITATQLGYVAGMIVLLPLGDLLENRALAGRMLVGTAVALVAAGLAPTFGLFLVASVAVGMTSSVTQILVPVAARLAPPGTRGRFIGRVMSGLLLGILLARTVSSLLADAIGWRSVYLISAGVMLVLAPCLRWVLPPLPPAHTTTYRALMRSLAAIVAEEPILRRRAISQALLFGTFTTFWTAIAYELIGEHGLTQSAVGIFALVGAAGAVAAPFAGRLADRGLARPARGIAIGMVAVALLITRFGQASVVALAAGGVLLDFAVQAHQVLSQQEVYGLRPEARSRINTIYMSTIFLVGAMASAAAGWVFDRAGWTGVTTVALVLPAGAFALWLTSRTPAMAPAIAAVTATDGGPHQA